MRRALGVCALAALVTASSVTLAGAATKPRLRVLAHLDPVNGVTADVYGHRGFAYLASWRGRYCKSVGVRVVDVRNAGAPRLVSSFGDAASDPSLVETWTEKVIVKHVESAAFTGELAVVSFQACLSPPPAGVFRGFALYDVTDPAHPQFLSKVASEPQTRGSHEIWLQAADDKAYVYTAIPFAETQTSPDGVTPGHPDFRIVDVSDPRAPLEVGSWGAWKTLGVRQSTGTGRGVEKGSFVHSVITNAAATRAYLSYWDLGTVILDISNPARPRYLGRTRFRRGEQGNAHSAAISANGRLLVETHEGRAGHPTLWDVSKPRRPVRLAEVVFPGSARDSVHDPRLLGKRAYFSWYGLGVVAADLSNPRHPHILARFAPPLSPPNPDFLCETPCTSVWGVSPAAGIVLASDMNAGLWVLRLR